MGGSMGTKPKKWNRELEEKLLAGIRKGKTLVELEIYMEMNKTSICKRIKDMGFDGLINARKVMVD